MEENQRRSTEILLVEDTETDVELTSAALKRGGVPHHLTVVSDGVEAIDLLRRQGNYAQARRPDLVLLDLNLPHKSGHEVLKEIKADEDLMTIPVIVLSSSKLDQDVVQAYALRANAYITKPGEFKQFAEVVRILECFWTNVVVLPP